MILHRQNSNASPRKIEQTSPTITRFDPGSQVPPRNMYADQVRQVAGGPLMSRFELPQRIQTLNRPVPQSVLQQQSRMSNQVGGRVIANGANGQGIPTIRDTSHIADGVPPAGHALNGLSISTHPQTDIQSTFRLPQSPPGPISGSQLRGSCPDSNMGNNVPTMSHWSSSPIPASPTLCQPNFLDPQLFEENCSLPNQSATVQRIGQLSSSSRKASTDARFQNNNSYLPSPQQIGPPGAERVFSVNTPMTSPPSQNDPRIQPQRPPSQPRPGRSTSDSGTVKPHTQTASQVVNLYNPVFEQPFYLPLRNSGWEVRTLQDVPLRPGSSTEIPSLVVSGLGTTVNFFNPRFIGKLHWNQEPKNSFQSPSGTSPNSNSEVSSASGPAFKFGNPPALVPEPPITVGIAEAEATVPKPATSTIEETVAVPMSISAVPQKKITDFLKPVSRRASEKIATEGSEPKKPSLEKPPQERFAFEELVSARSTKDQPGVEGPWQPSTRSVSPEDDISRLASSAQVPLPSSSTVLKLASPTHSPRLSPQLVSNHSKKSHNRPTKKRSVSPNASTGPSPKRQANTGLLNQVGGNPAVPSTHILPEGQSKTAPLSPPTKVVNPRPVSSREKEISNQRSIVGELTSMEKEKPILPCPPNSTDYPPFPPMSSGQYSASLCNQQLSQVHQHLPGHPFVATPEKRELIARLAELADNEQVYFESRQSRRGSWNPNEDNCQDSLLDLFGAEVDEGGQGVRYAEEWSGGHADWNQMGGDFQDLLELTKLAEEQNM